MNITRIKPPKFKVGRYVLNEYELRTLMTEVAEGKKPAGIKVTEGRQTAEILSTGRLSHNLDGLSIASMETLKVIRINRSK
jgi:hypothetical protein